MWPAWTLSLLMLVAMILTVTPSIPNRPRFFLMMGGPFLLGLLFSAWVLLLSRLRWKEKLLLAFAGIASPLIAAQVSVPEDALRTAMFIYGVPLAMFLTTTGLAAWHQHAHRSRLTAVVLLLGWLSFGLVRNNGFIGDYRPEFVWALVTGARAESAGPANLHCKQLHNRCCTGDRSSTRGVAAVPRTGRRWCSSRRTHKSRLDHKATGNRLAD